MNESNHSLIERLESGVVLVAEGYIFELERRGFLKAFHCIVSADEHRDRPRE